MFFPPMGLQQTPHNEGPSAMSSIRQRPPTRSLPQELLPRLREEFGPPGGESSQLIASVTRQPLSNHDVGVNSYSCHVMAKVETHWHPVLVWLLYMLSATRSCKIYDQHQFPHLVHLQPKPSRHLLLLPASGPGPSSHCFPLAPAASVCSLSTTILDFRVESYESLVRVFKKPGHSGFGPTNMFRITMGTMGLDYVTICYCWARTYVLGLAALTLILNHCKPLKILKPQEGPPGQNSHR